MQKPKDFLPSLLPPPFLSSILLSAVRLQTAETQGLTLPAIPLASVHDHNAWTIPPVPQLLTLSGEWIALNPYCWQLIE